MNIPVRQYPSTMLCTLDIEGVRIEWPIFRPGFTRYHKVKICHQYPLIVRHEWFGNPNPYAKAVRNA